MSQIKEKDTKPEMIVRKYLFSQGFRFRIHDKRYPGNPDVVLPKFKTCIFVNGCFWHVHQGCKDFVWPKSNQEFWNKKLNENVERDIRNKNLLEKAGWQVITVWECELRKDKVEETLLNIKKLIVEMNNIELK